MFIWALLPVKCDKNKENSNEYKLPLDGIQMNLESWRPSPSRFRKIGKPLGKLLDTRFGPFFKVQYSIPPSYYLKWEIEISPFWLKVDCRPSLILFSDTFLIGCMIMDYYCFKAKIKVFLKIFPHDGSLGLLCYIERKKKLVLKFLWGKQWHDIFSKFYFFLEFILLCIEWIVTTLTMQ